MEARYRYGHKPGRRRRTRVLIVFTIAFLVFGAAAALVYADLRKNQDSGSVEGTGRTVAQTLDESSHTVTLDHQYFTMEFPSDWKEISKTTSQNENSVTWQATKHREDNRYIKIYIDIIPKNYPLNRMVPLTSRGNGFSVGELSANCSTFTKGGLQAAGQAQFLQPEQAKWQGVDFICDLPQVTDNEAGTSSAEGINTVSATGSAKGKHNYFFVYVDHNIQRNDSIFYNALRSFKAK